MREFLYRFRSWFGSLDSTLQMILAWALCTFVLLTVFFGLLAIPSASNQRNVDPYFSVGGILENGKMINNPSWIYTEKLIECTAFEFLLDLGVDDIVNVHYYDDNGKWIASEPANRGERLARTYDQMIFNVNGKSVKAVGIRISAKSLDYEFSGAQRLFYSWNFKLTVSTGRAPEFSVVDPNFVIGEVTAAGEFKRDIFAVTGRSVVTKDVIDCSAFDLKFSEFGKYDILIHYYFNENWLCCEQMTDSLISVDAEKMDSLGATGIRISVSRDDNALMGNDDYFTPFVGLFREHCELAIVRHSSFAYSEPNPRLDFGVIDDSGRVHFSDDTKRGVTHSDILSCSAFSIALKEPNIYTAQVYFFNVDAAGVRQYIGSEKLPASGSLFKIRNEMLSLGANAVAFVFTKVDDRNFLPIIDYGFLETLYLDEFAELVVLD